MNSQFSTRKLRRVSTFASNLPEKVFSSQILTPSARSYSGFKTGYFTGLSFFSAKDGPESRGYLSSELGSRSKRA